MRKGWVYSSYIERIVEMFGGNKEYKDVLWGSLAWRIPKDIMFLWGPMSWRTITSDKESDIRWFVNGVERLINERTDMFGSIEDMVVDIECVVCACGDHDGIYSVCHSANKSTIENWFRNCWKEDADYHVAIRIRNANTALSKTMQSDPISRVVGLTARSDKDAYELAQHADFEMFLDLVDPGLVREFHHDWVSMVYFRDYWTYVLPKIECIIFDESGVARYLKLDDDESYEFGDQRKVLRVWFASIWNPGYKYSFRLTSRYGEQWTLSFSASNPDSIELAKREYIQ